LAESAPEISTHAQCRWSGALSGSRVSLPHAPRMGRDSRQVCRAPIVRASFLPALYLENERRKASVSMLDRGLCALAAAPVSARQRARWLGLFSALSVAAVLTGGCSRPPEKVSQAKPEASVPVRPRVFELRSALKSGPGKPCSRGGPSDCESGICLHTTAAIHDGFLCSSRCEVSSDCLDGWSCRQVHPDDPATVCVPKPAASANARRSSPLGADSHP
jgi:hypothetical protein